MAKLIIKENEKRKKACPMGWRGGGGGGGIYFPVIKEINLYISFLLTEPSGYGLYGLLKNVFFQNAAHAVQTTESSKKSMIILQVTTAIIIYF